MKVAEVLRRAAERLIEDAERSEDDAKEAAEHERSDEAGEARDHAGENRERAADLEAIVADFDKAAGDYAVSMPEIGSPMAVLLSANVLMRRDVATLRERQAVHLRQISNLSQTVPLESEVGEALEQSGSLLAEIGTLRSALAAERLLLDSYTSRAEAEEDRATPPDCGAAVNLAEAMASQSIADFLEHLANRAARYHVAPHAPAALRSAAVDVRDGRWRTS